MPTAPPAAVNRCLVALLRSPLHRLASGGLLALTVTGRRSGRRLTLPVEYAADGDRLIVAAVHASAKRWWRNLRGGAPVQVAWRGRAMAGTGLVLDGQAAADALAVWAGGRRGAAAHPGPDVAVVALTDLHPVTPA
jgi:hypothetical protein